MPVIVFGENEVWHAHHVKQGKLHSVQEAVKRYQTASVCYIHTAYAASVTKLVELQVADCVLGKTLKSNAETVHIAGAMPSLGLQCQACKVLLMCTLIASALLAD